MLHYSAHALRSFAGAACAAYSGAAAGGPNAGTVSSVRTFGVRYGERLTDSHRLAASVVFKVFALPQGVAIEQYQERAVEAVGAEGAKRPSIRQGYVVLLTVQGLIGQPTITQILNTMLNTSSQVLRNYLEARVSCFDSKIHFMKKRLCDGIASAELLVDPASCTPGTSLCAI